MHGLHIGLTYHHGAIHEFLGMRTSQAAIRTLSVLNPRARQAIKLLVDWGKAQRVVYHREWRMGAVRKNLKAIHVILMAALFLRRACLDQNTSVAQILRLLFHEFAASRFEELVFDVDRQEIRNRTAHEAEPPFILKLNNTNPLAQVPMRIIQLWRPHVANVLGPGLEEYSAARRHAWATTAPNASAITAVLQRSSVPATLPPGLAATVGPPAQFPGSAATASPPPPPPPPPPPTTPPPPMTPAPPTTPPPPTSPPPPLRQPVDVNVVEQTTGIQLVDLGEGVHTFLGGRAGSITYSVHGRAAEGYVIWLPGCDGGALVTRD